MHRLALRGLMNAGVAGDSRCRQTGRTWPRSLSLFYALFHYRLVLLFFFFRKKDLNDVILRSTDPQVRKKQQWGRKS